MHPALVPGSGILVNQALPGGAIEQLGRLELGIGGRVRSGCPLQNGPQVGTLRTVPVVGRARLAHVLPGGFDSRHSKKSLKKVQFCEGKKLAPTSRMSWRRIALTRFRSTSTLLRVQRPGRVPPMLASPP